MDGPYKLHLVAVGGLNQFAQQGGLLLGVRLAPLGTVVGVVLGTVHIDVHLVLAIEVELAQTVLVAPGVAVEAFYHAAARNAGPVRNLALHHLGPAHNLQQALHTVECAGLVLTGYHNLVRSNLQIISLCPVRYLLLVFLYRLVSFLTQDNGLGLRKFLGVRLVVHTQDVQLGGKQFHGIAVGPVCTDKIEFLGLVKCLSSPGCLLGKGRDGYVLLSLHHEGEQHENHH